MISLLYIFSTLFYRFGREVAEHSFVKAYNGFSLGYKDCGLMGVLFEATDNNLEDTMWYLCDNLVRLCHDVTDAEIARAKSALKTEILAIKGSGSQNASFNGSQLLTSGRSMSIAEIMVRIDALTSNDIKSAANKYINDEDHALAAVGPIFELPDYNWIRRRSYWHRF